MARDEEEKTETHESFGVAGFSRQSWGGLGANLFGSSIRSSTVIALSIKRADRKRNLNQEWIHGGDELIEVLFSPNQFANLLTSMNMGEGVPCTIHHLNNKGVKPCPSYEQRAKFEAEFKNDVRQVMADASTLAAEVETLFDTKKNINQSDRQEILSRLRKLVQNLNENLPFVQSQFNEAMDKTVTEAKAEVEGFVESKIRSLGINALTGEIAQALSAPAQSPVLQIESRTLDSKE